MTLDAYVIDSLMPDLVGHDRHPSAFLVYLLLWRLTSAGTGEARVALRDLAESAGLSKRAVQLALERLAKRRLIETRREGVTAVATYRVLTPWRRQAGGRMGGGSSGGEENNGE